MKSTVFCLALCAFVAYAKADTTTLSPFETFVKQAVDVIDEGLKKFQETTGIKTEFDKEKLLTFLKSSSTKFQETISELTKKLEKDSKPLSEEVKKNVDSFLKQVNETLKNLNSAETQGKVQKLQDQFATSLKEIASKVNDVAKSSGLAVPASVQKTLNEIVDEVSKTVKTLQEKGTQLAENAQAELKKKKTK